jgi:predicted N-acetyltransferase YhbS
MNQKRVSAIAIRRLGPNDVETVSKLIRTALNDINSKDYSPSVINNLGNYYSPIAILEMLHDRMIYVACLDNQIVGTVSLKDNSILTLFVESTKLNRGIGTLLMTHVESIARKKGYQSVTVVSSLTAYPFYRKIGFQTTRSQFSKKK